MPTTKHRINISVPQKIDDIIQILAKRDKISASSKVLELLDIAIEMEEDAVLIEMANERDTKKARYISHASAWK